MELKRRRDAGEDHLVIRKGEIVKMEEGSFRRGSQHQSDHEADNSSSAEESSGEEEGAVAACDPFVTSSDPIRRVMAAGSTLYMSYLMLHLYRALPMPVNCTAQHKMDWMMEKHPVVMKILILISKHQEVLHACIQMQIAS